MTDKNDKHIAEQIANSFNNNNDKNFLKDSLKKFEEARIKVNEQKQSVEQIGFIKGDEKTIADSMTCEEKQALTFSPYKYPDFLTEQSPESLRKQFLQTLAVNFLDPLDSDN